MKVYMIDDDPIILSFMGFILEYEGFTVDYCLPPLNDTMYHAIEEFSPDVILLDIYLGESENCINVFNQIKKINSLKHIPIIGVSSTECLEDKLKIFALGFSDFIHKPFSNDSLVKIVKRYANISQLVCLCKKIGRSKDVESVNRVS